MKYLDEFRDPQLCRRLIDEMLRIARRRWTIMEVCGGQTHSLLRYGLDELLSPAIELIHGPGCPVCVTPAEMIDHACRLAVEEQVVLCSFGDMLRVPGSSGSLHTARAQGGDVRLVYSPLDAVRRAAEDPHRQIVFFAVGFETTAPATALALSRAAAWGLQNFRVLSAHVRVLPAMETIAAAPGRRVQGFLAAGHVCTVTGYAEYYDFVRRHALPVVVAGFEPVDLLRALYQCVQLLESGKPELHNAYGRSAREPGNPRARQMIERWLRPVDAAWRGLGTIRGGGLALAEEAARFDAARRWPLAQFPASEETTECRAGEVLLGQLKPSDCPHFGSRCTPDHPLGAPMVSSEGACAAYQQFAAAARRPPAPIPALGP